MARPAGHLEQIRALGASGRLAFIGGVRADGASRITAYEHVGEKVDFTIDVPAHVHALTLTDDAVAAACADGVVRIYAQKGGAPLREIKAHEGACHSLAFRGGELATGGDDGFLRVFTFSSGKKKKEWQLSSRPLRAVAIDPAGESFAAGGDDGVVRVIREGDPQRDMAGHDGPVTCLTFTPADGRLVSGGEDGTVRIWYLVGAVESDVRGKDDTLHTGGTTALLFPPAKDPQELGERLVSAGADGKLRVWRMSERRKPRTLEAGSKAIHALAFAPSTRVGTLGAVLAGGDDRTIYVYQVDAAGAPGERASATTTWGHGFDVFTEELAAAAAPKKREEAVRALARLGESEAFDLLVATLASDPDADVRALAASELAAHGRRDAKKALRPRLDDANTKVRRAALDALRTLEPEAPLSPLRAALDSRFADTRVAALELLPAEVASSPLAVALIASRLADDDAGVRHAAVAQLVGLEPAGSVEPLRTSFERGRADVRAEVLVRGALAGLAASPAFATIVGKALDDEDADVRRMAFVVTVLTRPPLVAWLEARDEAFGRALAEIIRRSAELTGKTVIAEGVDKVASKVRDISSHFANFIHPVHGDVSIFKPTIHTPIKAGDEVRLIGIKPVGPDGHAQLRATDYVVGVVAESSAEDLAALRARFVTSNKSAAAPGEADREPLLAALACRTADTALRGARGLALLSDMRALGALLTISRESDPALRRETAGALMALDDPRARRRLVWMISDGESSVRDAALACYAKVEGDPLVVADAALHASHEDVRVRGLDILVKTGRGKEVAETLLANAIEDESPKVRSEAFRTLWAWHDTQPLGPLDRALSARFPDLRRRAVDELAALAKKKDSPLAAPALERLAKEIADRDAGVAKAAYDAMLEIKGKEDSETHLGAIASTHPSLRVQGARDAHRSPLDRVRSALMKLLEDIDASVRVAAIETLDWLSQAETGAVAVGLQSSHLDLRVRAAELLAMRREESVIDPMRALLADKELLLRMPPNVIVPLRQRAAMALANVGTPRLLKYFATELVKDDDPAVREQAARGLSNASRRGEEGYLLDLLGHEELAVRSWAAEGLARLGDPRALPVLTGTLKHEHPPIRIGAVLSFAALGPEGYAGMLLGLEDPSREVQRIVLSVILARDLRAFRRNESPDLLASALSSQRPEVRFAAARALELRIDAEQYTAHLVEMLMPERPDTAEELQRWPNEELRARLMMGLADALAGDRSEQRYAASQALRLRDRPLDYFREVQRAVMPRSVNAPWVPDTQPRSPATPSDAAKKGPLALLRRMFAGGAGADASSAEPAPSAVPEGEQVRLRMLAFGAYVGLLRHGSTDDEAHRVRRDAIERIVDLVERRHVSITSATPALARSLDDAHHLVRQAAFVALKKLYANDPETPLSLALVSSSADVVKAALDELAARGEVAKPRIVKALDSQVAPARKYAFELLEKLSPPGSLEPLLAALGSEHPDIRIGVLERLATSQDTRVSVALGKALESEHDDLRLRAAEMLASRRDDRAAEALAPWLRSDDAAAQGRARDALARLASPAAVRTLSARLEDTVPEAERRLIAETIAKTHAGQPAIDALSTLLTDEDEAVRRAAFEGAIAIVGPRSDAVVERGAPKPKPRDAVLARRFLEAGARSRYASTRVLAARELDDLADPAAEAILTSLFGDRDPTVRPAAVAAYAHRVKKKGAPPGPLEDVLRGGARETMLAAAEGLAERGVAAALRPLLLFARAGEGGERERALLGLGALGDKRALEELETIASGGTEEAPAEVPMQAAALEALGRLVAKLAGEDRERIRDKVESCVGTKEPAMALAAVRGLRWMGGERGRSRIEAVLAEKTSAPAERVEAARSLGEMGESAIPAELVLGRALDDDDADVRWTAREALEKLFASDRTRVEFLAVESKHADISEPAATYLANEGEAGRLLGKLAKLANETLRSRIRFGLVRRDVVANAELEKLLADPSAAARGDAAWIVGARAHKLGASDKKPMASALLAAARRAEQGFSEAERTGLASERDGERDAWTRAVWAARLVDPAVIRESARSWLVAPRLPAPVRLESAFALRGGGPQDVAALTAVLADGNPSVRSAAAAALSPVTDPRSLATAPLDPVRLGLATRGTLARADALATPEGRRVFLAAILGGRDGKDTRALREVAARPGEGQRDAIAALGRAATNDAIAALAALAARNSGANEETRRAAHRSLRRAQRIQARKVEVSS